MPRAKGTGTSTPKSRGAYGNTRSTPARSAKQVTRRKNREGSSRHKSAAEEVAEVQRKLDKLGGQGPAEGARYSGMTARIMAQFKDPEVVIEEPVAEAASTRMLPTQKGITLPSVARDARGEKGWSVGQARAMIRQGYRIDAVIRRTGWGPDWFDDLDIDDEGYGMTTDEFVNRKGRK